jgi:hypothetical protein
MSILNGRGNGVSLCSIGNFLYRECEKEDKGFAAQKIDYH